MRRLALIGLLALATGACQAPTVIVVVPTPCTKVVTTVTTNPNGIQAAGRHTELC